MSKSAPTNITLPGHVLEATDSRLMEPLQTDQFYGRASRSMVIRALLEIALENDGAFKPEAVRDYESLKSELRRILKDGTRG